MNIWEKKKMTRKEGVGGLVHSVYPYFLMSLYLYFFKWLVTLDEIYWKSNDIPAHKRMVIFLPLQFPPKNYARSHTGIF